MPDNTEQPIRFSEKYLTTIWLTDVNEYYVAHRTIVINLGNKKAQIAVVPETSLQPRTSTILNQVTIKDGDSLLLIEIVNDTNIGGIVLDSGWNQLGEIANFPKDVPLWKSPQYEVGIVSFDPYFVTGLSEQVDDGQIKQYRVKVNLWFAPTKTHCAIHNSHTTPEILEIHTQIYGIGRMQKFHANEFNTLYQEVTMSPGETHIPFASVGEGGDFVYPWHQYYADIDCIWVANEFHPITNV